MFGCAQIDYFDGMILPALEPVLELSGDDTDDNMPALERIGNSRAMMRWSCIGNSRAMISTCHSSL